MLYFVLLYPLRSIVVQ